MAKSRILLMLALSLLVVYGMIVPQLFISRVDAHNLGNWAVRNGRIDYFNEMDLSLAYEKFVILAAMQWEAYGAIEIAETTNRASAEVFLQTFCTKRVDIMGVADNSTRTVRFNSCYMEHDGGRFGNLGQKKATSPSRKARTFVHEFGHALGFSHTADLNHSQSVMSVYYSVDARPKIRLANHYKTVFLLRDHDESDMRRRWG